MKPRSIASTATGCAAILLCATAFAAEERIAGELRSLSEDGSRITIESDANEMRTFTLSGAGAASATGLEPGQRVQVVFDTEGRADEALRIEPAPTGQAAGGMAGSETGQPTSQTAQATQDPDMQDRPGAGAGTVDPGPGATGTTSQAAQDMDRETGLQGQILPATATPGWMQSLAGGMLLLIGAAGLRWSGRLKLSRMARRQRTR